MNHLLRYWRLWHSLPDDERRARAGRVVERLLRRRPAVRRLGIVPDQPRWHRFRRALCVSPAELVRRIREDDARRGPLFGNLESRAAVVASTCPQQVEVILGMARRLLDRRFDLLGSGEARPLRDDGGIDWQLDWKSGLRWPDEVYYTDLAVVRGDGSDVKLPWELARFQHLLVLAQACHLAPLDRSVRDPSSLVGRCATEVRQQIDDWIVRNPRGVGIHWTCTMEVGIRACVWLACLALLRRAPELDDAFIERLARSLWVHGRHIRRNLEIGRNGLTSNHFLSDVIGLYALGCGLPELDEAEGWRRFGREALLREMERQVHRDGVNFERSIPYHRLVTEIFLHGLLLGDCVGEPFPKDYRQRLGRMLEFVASYSRPDGSSPQWGDNDDGRLLPLTGYASTRPDDHRHLLALGGRLLRRDDLAGAACDRHVEALWLLGPPLPAPPSRLPAHRSRAFSDAGFHVLRGDDLHATIACGPVGTAGEGNHTHNDLLALSVWAAGVEWITDPGTGCYTGDPELRNRLRSTSAHATLQLGRREQQAFGSDLDQLFRMHERAHPTVHDWESSEQGARLVASHRGFSGNGERWTHERTVLFERGLRIWRLADRLSLETKGDLPAASVSEKIHLRYPLRPGTQARILDESESWPDPLQAAMGALSAGGRRRVAIRLSVGEARFWIGLDLPAGSEVDLCDALYSPRYGVVETAGCVSATLPGATETRPTTVLWAPPPPTHIGS